MAVGGRRPGGLDTGFYFEPTILTDVSADSRIAQEEVFGPVLSVLRYSDDDEAVAIANNSQYGLSRCGVGYRRRPRRRRRPPRPHRADRRKRLHPRRCAVRRVQTERVGARGWRPSRTAPVHGAEGHRNTRMTGALAGVRVVEIAGNIAGPYCTKLLVDLGAEVTKIEPPSGDPLRELGTVSRWHSRPQPLRHVRIPQRRKAWGNNRSRRRCVGRARPDRAGAPARRWAAARGAGPIGPRRADIDRRRAQDSLSFASRTSVSTGRLCDRDATPLTVQAASGWVNNRDPDRPPVQAGARISEYVAGGYAALGALTALRAQSANEGRVVEVDVSVLESLLSSLPYPMLMAEKMRSLGLPANTKAGAMMGIVRAADGWIGINCLTGQHWLDVCAMLGLPEYGEHQIAIMLGGPERAEFFEKAQPWLSERTVTEIVELSQAMRIPAAPVNDGATVMSTARSTEIAGSSWTRTATVGRSGGPAPHSACRRRPRCRCGPPLAR